MNTAIGIHTEHIHKYLYDSYVYTFMFVALTIHIFRDHFYF